MAEMLKVDPQGMSVRELINVLKECPDPDAWVVMPESAALDNYRHDPFRKLVGVRATGSATVELVGKEGDSYY
jgi:hypothetical protein